MKLQAALSAIIVLACVNINAGYADDYQGSERRDPFVPLVDEKGFRSDLFRAGPEGELPVKLQIMGILYSEGAAMAIVNGEVVKEGDYIGEIKVEKIDEKGIEVSYRNKIYKLVLRAEDEGTSIAK